jgi:hypothetical protein
MSIAVFFDFEMSSFSEIFRRSFPAAGPTSFARIYRRPLEMINQPYLHRIIFFRPSQWQFAQLPNLLCWPAPESESAEAP